VRCRPPTRAGRPCRPISSLEALIVLALVQFMLVLDVTVVKRRAARIQQNLGFTHSGLAWGGQRLRIDGRWIPPPRWPA